MPPRRSARSATVEPELNPSSTTAAKRKRSQAPSDEISGKETKPTRLSVGPSSKGRTSTRPRPSLKEVEESDEEEEEGDLEDSPPVKKSRPSPEIEDSEDDDDKYAEEEEVVKPKERKSLSAKKGKGRASEDDDSDDAWDEPPKAVSKGRKSTSKPKRAPAPGSGGRKPKLQVNSSDDDAGMDVSVEDKPASKGRVLKSTAPASFSPPARTHGSNEEVDDSDVEPMPVKKKASKPKPASGRVATSSDDGDGEKSGNNTSAAVTQDEEIEESLLDPIPPSMFQAQSLSQAPPPPEEPTGPKSRLTIHKMALVNFKSYAGRQEIGPFHKVCTQFTIDSHSSILMMYRVFPFVSLVLLIHRRPQRLRQIKYDRRIIVCVRIPRVQDEAGEALGTHTQLGKIL